MRGSQSFSRALPPPSRRPLTFWSGVVAVTVGVMLTVPMFAMARHEHFMLHGMPIDRWMVAGMICMGLGLVLVFVGLIPQRIDRRGSEAAASTPHAFESMQFGPAHLKLIVVLIVAIAIDTLKPFSFTFILPGVAHEYGLSTPAHSVPGAWPVAYLPLAGITGTAVGSLLWGHLADRVGRRPALLFAAAVFIATSTCATMPQFWQNMMMCFVMGLSAGGLLPIAYTLLTEIVPTRRRGQVVVLTAGVGTAAGFLLTSWLADWLIPHFGWRIMWFLGLPTGLVLICLSRYVPESPRFLLATGRDREAQQVMRTFGAAPPAPTAERPQAPEPVNPPRPRVSGVSSTGVSIALVACGLAWGFVNFGFLVWLPSELSASTLTAHDVTALLAKASLFAVPGAVLAAWLYEAWSSKGTLVSFAAVMAGVLVVFAIAGDALADKRGPLMVLIVFLLVGLWAVIAVLAPYAAEVYATSVRAAGSGAVAGATKLGGVVALVLSVSHVNAPSLAAAAGLCAVLMLLATVAVAALAIETRGRNLEDIASTLDSSHTAQAGAR